MAKRARSDTGLFDDSSPSSNDVDTPTTDAEVHTPKYAQTEPTEPNRPCTTAMRCALPPHKLLVFPTYDEYATHYQQLHTNRCSECQANFPTFHLLSLHIAETHDPLVAARRSRDEKTFACFVEDCDKVCRDWKKRRSHLIDKHGFPRNYDFFVVTSGIEGRRSMLRPGVDAQGHRKSSRERSHSSDTADTETTDATSVSRARVELSVSKAADKERHKLDAADVSTVHEKMDTSVDDIVESMSSLKMVPRSVTFGRRKQAGFSKG